MTSQRQILVTGAAGFIGHAVAHRLLDHGDAIIGVDNLNDYYDVRLKEARVATLSSRERFSLHRLDIADDRAISRLVREAGITHIVHLAAQAGVRHSIENPFSYQRSNLHGHLSVLEACRAAPRFEHLVYASSSSVYGDNAIEGGFREDDPAASPVSLYAATKRSCELMSESYARLYGLPQTGLRFFTVYGPWGRPDMAYFSFTRRILAGHPIEVYGQGRMARDFTYIDDIVDGIVDTLAMTPRADCHRLLNIGDSRPVGLMTMIETLEALLGKSARKVMKPMQPGDVAATFANTSRINALTGYKPKVMLDEGLSRFVDWYRKYHNQ